MAFLRRQVRRIHDMGENGPPIINPDKQIGDGCYSVWDMLCPLTNDAVIWEKSGENILSFIRSEECVQVNNASIDNIFGHYRNGVRKRAVRCMQSGHINLTSWKFAKVKLKTSEEPVTLITIQVMASMKSETYDVGIVMTMDRKYDIAPASGCDCPAGQHFCSHMLAFFLLMYALQKKNVNNVYILTNYDACLKLFPNVHQIRNSLVSCKYLN